MANITKTNNTTVIAKEIKGEKEMTNAERIINNVVNITPAAHANKVTLVKKAGTSYLKLNDFIAGAIGGTQKEQDANVRCIQFVVDNCDENEGGYVLAQQCAALTSVMADLEKVNLDDILKIGKSEFIIDVPNKKAYTEYGELRVDVNEIYPNLTQVELTNEAIRAILVGELSKTRAYQFAQHSEQTVEDNEEINIEANQKLSIIDTIKGLRTLGMTASWFDINGERQSFPICYNGESDLKEFTKVVKDSLDNDKDYLGIIFASCRMKENELTLDDETLVINNINCVIDYTKKEIWDEDVNVQLATLEDIEYELPQEAVKIMLIERAKAEIERYQDELAMIDMYDYDGDDEEDYIW